MTTILLNEADAARLMGLKPKTLGHWRFQSRGPAYCKLGGAVRYRLKDLEAFIVQAIVDNG